LGGTFNPPHMGHLLLAQEAMDKFALEKIIFIPTAIPPHKRIRRDSAELRYKMVKLACKENPKFEASKIELQRSGVSYSVDTLRTLKKKYGRETELYFIAGSDSLTELETWKNIEEVLKLAHFIVAERPGFSSQPPKRKIRLIRTPGLDISSSIIRKRIRHSQSIRYLVPETVRRFIEKNKLYR